MERKRWSEGDVAMFDRAKAYMLEIAPSIREFSKEFSETNQRGLLAGFYHREDSLDGKLHVIKAKDTYREELKKIMQTSIENFSNVAIIEGKLRIRPGIMGIDDGDILATESLTTRIETIPKIRILGWSLGGLSPVEGQEIDRLNYTVKPVLAQFRQ